MECQRALDALSEYIDGTLGSKRYEEIHAHLTQCAACRRELEELTRLKMLLSGLPSPKPRADFWQRAHGSLHAAASPENARRRNVGGWRIPTSLRLAAVAPRFGFFATTAGALALVVMLTLPAGLKHVPAPPQQIAMETNASLKESRVPSNLSALPASQTVFSQNVSAESLVAMHAGIDVSRPLSEMGRMRYTVAEASQADLDQDGALDIY